MKKPIAQCLGFIYIPAPVSQKVTDSIIAEPITDGPSGPRIDGSALQAEGRVWWL